ncbi:MAG: hypothetical protein J07HQW1_03089, partial [Haloquadratum walsbyi J07HQW1]
MAPDDVRVLEDTERRFADGTVFRVRVLSVPESENSWMVSSTASFRTEDETTLIR